MAAHREFHMDAVYPEPLSRLHHPQQMYRRAVRKNPRRGGAASGRYRTQPVTFAEIKEVDEDSLADDVRADRTAAASSEIDLQAAISGTTTASRRSAGGDDGSRDSKGPSVGTSRKGPAPEEEEEAAARGQHQRRQQPRPSI